jgi:hypothetical protein
MAASPASSQSTTGLWPPRTLTGGPAPTGDAGLNRRKDHDDWKTAQFGIYGDRNGSEATFSTGTKLKVNLVTHSGTKNAPTCVPYNSTGESNNLFLQPAPTLMVGAAPSIQSEQDRSQPTMPAACATAKGYGEIHLDTFGCASCSKYLTYPFQATGDFQLAAAPCPPAARHSPCRPGWRPSPPTRTCQ